MLYICIRPNLLSFQFKTLPLLIFSCSGFLPCFFFPSLLLIGVVAFWDGVELESSVVGERVVFVKGVVFVEGEAFVWLEGVFSLFVSCSLSSSDSSTSTSIS